MQLQVQKDSVPARLQLPDDVGTGGIIQLHADLDEGAVLPETVQKGKRLFGRRKITRDNHITHLCCFPRKAGGSCFHIIKFHVLLL